MPAESRPRVSVVMPLYNGAAFVRDAVASVLRQTWSDLELIVVDDGSTDDGPDIVAAEADPRVRLLRLARNQGISAALNVGIAEARADHIARMDADDESLPTRLSEQLAFLDAHPAVGVVGTQLLLMDTAGQVLRPYPLLTRDADLRRLLLLRGPFCHGSVMFRRSVFDRAGGYVGADEPAEDYALWLRMAAVTELANLPSVLYRLRVGPHSVSAVRGAEQLEQRDRIRARARAAIGDPVLTRELLREGVRHYSGLPEVGPALAATFISSHRQLASLDLAARGRSGLPNVLSAAAAGRMSPRDARRMWADYRDARVAMGRPRRPQAAVPR